MSRRVTGYFEIPGKRASTPSTKYRVVDKTLEVLRKSGEWTPCSLSYGDVNQVCRDAIMAGTFKACDETIDVDDNAVYFTTMYNTQYKLIPSTEGCSAKLYWRLEYDEPWALEESELSPDLTAVADAVYHSLMNRSKK